MCIQNINPENRFGIENCQSLRAKRLITLLIYKTNIESDKLSCNAETMSNLILLQSAVCNFPKKYLMLNIFM